jgi:hypothetical protein
MKTTIIIVTLILLLLIEADNTGRLNTALLAATGKGQLPTAPNLGTGAG